MQVVWDPRKAAANLRKHKISFEEASTVFADSLALTGADPVHSIGQVRWITFGESVRGRLLVVAHTDEGISFESSVRERQLGARRDSMKKAKRTRSGALRRSYSREDFPEGLVRGKYAARFAKDSNMVRLDPEIHAAFPTSEAVNEALAGLLRVAKVARLSKRSSGRSTSSRR
jgi:uncharacterized protein